MNLNQSVNVFVTSPNVAAKASIPFPDVRYNFGLPVIREPTNTYEGPYDVTPSDSPQILYTKDKQMLSDITVYAVTALTDEDIIAAVSEGWFMQKKVL